MITSASPFAPPGHDPQTVPGLVAQFQVPVASLGDFVSEFLSAAAEVAGHNVGGVVALSTMKNWGNFDATVKTVGDLIEAEGIADDVCGVSGPAAITFDPLNGKWGENSDNQRIATCTAWKASTEEQAGLIADRLVAVAHALAEKWQLLSAGVSADPEFDLQHTIVERPDFYGSPLLPEGRFFVCGYYWTTILGQQATQALPPAPKEIAALCRADGNTTSIQICDSPVDLHLAVDELHHLRSWLQPLLSGWLVDSGRAWPLPLVEGPALPYPMAPLIAQTVRLIDNLTRYQAIIDRQFEEANEVRLGPLNGTEWTFELAPGSPQEISLAGLHATLQGLVHTIGDGRIDSTLGLSWGEIEKSGPLLTVRLNCANEDKPGKDLVFLTLYQLALEARMGRRPDEQPLFKTVRVASK